MTSVSRIIEERSASVVQRWAEMARRAASARGMEEPELVDVIPRYLASLARDGSEEERAALIEEHFVARMRAGFQLAEIIDEITLLGGAVAAEWMGPGSTQPRPSAADVAALYEELRVRAIALTEMFAKHMVDDEQTDKLYVHRIDRAARRSRGKPEMLACFLDIALDIAMDAMDAQTATVLLREPATGRLRAMSSRGLANELIEGYATAPGALSFAGQVAAGEDCTAQADVASTPLEVSDALRESGIQTLLGVRMPPRNGVAGVLYVGRTARRSFSRPERRRLELLADRVLFHVESAALHDELRSSVEALEIEKELRERFVALLAHDLRTPLSTARTAAHLLAAHPEALDQRRDLALRIERSIVATDRMVRDLLDANRIRAGQPLPLELAECDLGALIERVARELAVVYGERFSADVPERVAGVWDEGELQRALWNLATNAVKYGAPDGVVTLSARRRDAHVLLAVHNVGEPLSPEAQARVFEPFVRLPHERRPGWGLGLTLVRGCAEAHGGRVLVESTREAGTTFTIELPLDARSHAIATSVAHAAASP